MRLLIKNKMCISFPVSAKKCGCFKTSSSRNNTASGLVVAEEEEEEMVVVGSIDGPHGAFGCDIYCFQVKFTDEKEFLTDGRTDQHTLMQRCKDASKIKCVNKQ